MSETFSKVEIITGVDCRRRFTTKQKLSRVAQSDDFQRGPIAVLEAHHSRKIALEWRKDGEKLLSGVELIPPKGKRPQLGCFLRRRYPSPAPPPR
jgi:hypothetical protein